MAATDSRTRGGPPELERAMQALSAISGDLLASYRDLERRAQHVEQELCRANAELVVKIGELDRATRHLTAVLETLPTGVVVRDGAGRIVRANPAACAILGVRAEELIGGDGAGAVEPAGLMGERADGEAHEVECADGVVRVIASRHSRIAADDASLAGSVEILDDRTEVTELAERLHGLDKLAALGNMAGGIAHEIRNPMNAIKGYAALLRKRAPDGSDEARFADRICAGADEADEILGSMLTLASPERLSLETVDASALIAEVVDALRATVGERHAITTDADPIRFPGDRVKLRQALRNLVANALQVQPDGGRVHVEASLADDCVVLRVTDAGPGIPAALRKRVLEPFYTTRADGTGLGLALVSTIAGLHGGSVEIPPTPSALGGADVRLRIPHRSPTART